jgi:glycerate-2-kinase
MIQRVIRDLDADVSFPAPRFRNFDALAGHGQKDLRRLALEVAQAGLCACDAGRATLEAVALTEDGIRVGARELPLSEGSRVVLVGAGKATFAIAAALEARLGERIDAGLIAVRHDQETVPLGDRIEVEVADHPLPSERSAAVAARLLAMVEPLGPEDIVLACFTGGSSALASLPPAGIPVGDKRALHELLLASGMPIAAVNTVRKHVSRIKGGRLAAAAAPARVVNLTVSDVAGDVLDVLTDPSVQDTSTAADARAVLDAHGLWGQVPESVRAHLRRAAAESPSLDPALVHTELLVTGHGACAAMIAAAATAGTPAVQLSTSLEGEARELGRLVANLARGSATEGAPFAPPVVLVGCGGEAGVTLGPGAGFGTGGPNQDAAIAAALELEGAPVAAVMIDTDGSDGSTEWAGAVADGTTVARARELGLDLRQALLSHRSAEPLAALGDLVDTGATGTNVNDLIVLAVGAGQAGRGARPA